MNAKTRIIAFVSALFGLGILLDIRPVSILLFFAGVLLFLMSLLALWGAVIAYNWYNLEAYDKRDKNKRH